MSLSTKTETRTKIWPTLIWITRSSAATEPNQGRKSQGEAAWRRTPGEAGDLLSLLSEATVTLNWPSLHVLCMFLILKDWLWQPLQRTKVRGTRYVQPAVYDRWPFNRLGPLKLLLDPPVDLFLMRADFFFLPRSPPKPPFFISLLLCGWTPKRSLKSPNQCWQERAAQSNPDWLGNTVLTCAERTVTMSFCLCY